MHKLAKSGFEHVLGAFDDKAPAPDVELGLAFGAAAKPPVEPQPVAGLHLGL